MTENSKLPAAKKTIEDPPEYSAAPEDPSQAAPSSSLDEMPPWSIPVAENVTHSPGGNVQGAWDSGNPGGVAIEDPSEAAPSNSSGRGKPPEPISQDLRGQLKWNEQRTGETDDWLGGPQNGAEAPPKESGDYSLGGWAGAGAKTEAEFSGRGKPPEPVAQEGIARNPQRSDPPEVEKGGRRTGGARVTRVVVEAASPSHRPAEVCGMDKSPR